MNLSFGQIRTGQNPGENTGKNIEEWPRTSGRHSLLSRVTKLPLKLLVKNWGLV